MKKPEAKKEPPPTTTKILTSQLREEICYSLISRSQFPEEQKGCRKGTRVTGDLLYIDQHILKENKTRRKKSSPGVDWLHKSIWHCHAKLDNRLSQNVQDEVIKFIENTMDNWRMELIARGKSLGEIPEKDLPRRCTITITICRSDSTEPHT